MSKIDASAWTGRYGHWDFVGSFSFRDIGAVWRWIPDNVEIGVRLACYGVRFGYNHILEGCKNETSWEFLWGFKQWAFWRRENYAC